jgi:hypothetical protein
VSTWASLLLLLAQMLNAARAAYLRHMRAVRDDKVHDDPGAAFDAHFGVRLPAAKPAGQTTPNDERAPDGPAGPLP